jgi:hypothetical protein
MSATVPLAVLLTPLALTLSASASALGRDAGGRPLVEGRPTAPGVRTFPLVLGHGGA